MTMIPREDKLASVLSLQQGSELVIGIQPEGQVLPLTSSYLKFSLLCVAIKYMYAA